MPFLRVSRDQRGYENTFLLHAQHPGARPRVLYWYRSAPGVRVGRPALDEDAIRVIEDQHPDIEFDWPHILEEANTLPPEVERRPERPRRKPQRPRDPEVLTPPREIPASQAPQGPPERDIVEEGDQHPSASAVQAQSPVTSETRAEPGILHVPRNPLLDELVGREIAVRLRARFADIQTRIQRQAADDVSRMRWQERANALNPDSWVTPEAILEGVQRADRLFDQLRREIAVTE